MVPSEWSAEVKMVKLIKEQVKQVGIGIKEKILDLNTYLEFAYQPEEDQFDVTMSSEEPGPNGSWIWEYVRSPGSGGKGWNQSFYANPEMDETMIKYLSEIDLDKRKEYAFKLQEIMAEDLLRGLYQTCDQSDRKHEKTDTNYELNRSKSNLFH
jgi:peptide/nickel transport system substrate-binding protein